MKTNLEKPIPIVLEQFECKECKKKFYINTEDKEKFEMECPFCKNKSENIRTFDIEILAIEEK